MYIITFSYYTEKLKKNILIKKDLRLQPEE